MRALQSQDGKKIVDVLTKLPKGQEFCTCLPHLEAEKTFGLTKRRLDMLFGLESDSHYPNKVNFFHPCVHTRSTAAHLNANDTCTNALVPFTWSVLKTGCKVTKWHITWINKKSKKWFHTIQENNKSKCLIFIVKRTGAPTYRGVKQHWGAEGTNTKDFWFLLNQIAMCVMDPKHDFVLTSPELLDVWPVLIETKFLHHKILEL